MIASFVIYGMTAEPSPTVEDKEDKVETVAKAEKEEEPKETEEEKIAREAKETEEKVLAEQKANEEAEAESVVATTWQDKVNEIAIADGSPTDKYDAIMLYAKEYPSTDDEIAEFEKYIIDEYKSKRYIADITNSEYMVGNIFRANVINIFYGQVNSPINDFAFDFYQNTKYTYRGVDAVDSDAVRSNERQMDKALEKIQ
ncbi:MAG: hypothetical protein ABS942_17390 [Solibacillus sp.]